MFKAHLQFALGNLLREKAYALLNVAGLTLGIACFIITGLYFRHELSYDRYNVNHERIYRVLHETDYGNTRTKTAAASNYLGPLLFRDYPQVQNYVTFRSFSDSDPLFRTGDTAYYMDWQRVLVADNSVFDIFTHEILAGDPTTALTRPGTMAVNASTARLFFGTTDAVGKTLSSNGSDYEITLVYADQPDNTHLKYDMLLANLGALGPAKDLDKFRGNLWGLNSFNFVLMQPGLAGDGNVSEEVFPDFFDRMMADITRPGYRARFYLEPLDKIHMHSVVDDGMPSGNIYYLYAFGIVGLFILFIACANYINLATASATRRSREIAIRKLIGAKRRELLVQFLCESVVFSLVALVLAVLLVELLLTGSLEINLLGKELTLAFWDDSLTFTVLLALGIGVGVIAGLYPAYYLATLESSGQARDFRKRLGNRIREGLVLIQFTISITVISATILMFLQMRFVDNQPLGFDKENKLVLHVQGADAFDQAKVFRDELKASPLVRDASLVTGNPITNHNGAALEADRDDGSTWNLNFSFVRTDANFIDAMGLNLIAGRNFDPATLDSQQFDVIINQTMANEIGWDDPLGKTYSIGGWGPFTVIGMVEDFHFENMHTRIRPFLFFPDVYNFDNASPEQKAGATRELIVDIGNAPKGQALDFIQSRWNVFQPDYPLQYEFLTDKIDALYQSDNRQMSLIGIFALICILISCLGLFGLTAYTTALRTKEIGIRKVLGAMTWQIVVMLFRKIFVLMLIASAIATVVAWLGISGWLEGFYYRDTIHPVAFVIAAGLSILVAFATSTLQSWQVARRSPVTALRYE